MPILHSEVSFRSSAENYSLEVQWDSVPRKLGNAFVSHINSYKIKDTQLSLYVIYFINRTIGGGNSISYRNQTLASVI